MVASLPRLLCPLHHMMLPTYRRCNPLHPRRATCRERNPDSGCILPASTSFVQKSNFVYHHLMLEGIAHEMWQSVRHHTVSNHTSTDLAFTQVVVSYPEQNPNSADTSLHASQHPSSQIAADGQNTTYNPKNPYYTSHPQHQQQQYQDHSVQSSSDQHHQERAGSPKPPYPGQNRPYQHKDPHQEERRAPTPHSLLPPQAATPAHPYMLSASPHHAQDVTLRNKDNEGPYEPGALLQATSHLRRLSFELANHGLNSQSAGAAGPAVLHGLQQLHNNVNSAPQLQFGNMNVQTSSQQPPGGTGHGAAQRQAPRRFAGDPGGV